MMANRFLFSYFEIHLMFSFWHTRAQRKKKNKQTANELCFEYFIISSDSLCSDMSWRDFSWYLIGKRVPFLDNSLVSSIKIPKTLWNLHKDTTNCADRFIREKRNNKETWNWKPQRIIYFKLIERDYAIFGHFSSSSISDFPLWWSL